MPKFGTKNALFGYFWPKMLYLGNFGQEFKKKYCHIWNQHPQICQNVSLTYTIDFGIGSAFSKGLGPGSGLGNLLYTAALRTGNWLVLLVQMETAHRFHIMTPLNVWYMCILDIWVFLFFFRMIYIYTFNTHNSWLIINKAQS